MQQQRAHCRGSVSLSADFSMLLIYRWRRRMEAPAGCLRLTSVDVCPKLAAIGSCLPGLDMVEKAKLGFRMSEGQTVLLARWEKADDWTVLKSEGLVQNHFA